MALRNDAAELDAKEYQIPGIMLGIGVGLHLTWVVFAHGAAGIPIALAVTGIMLCIQVVLGVIACLLTAKITGANYGLFWPGCVKLAAIFVVCGFVMTLVLWLGAILLLSGWAAAVIPWLCIGFLLSIFVCWGLLQWLFELEMLETAVTIIMIGLANYGAISLATMALRSMSDS